MKYVTTIMFHCLSLGYLPNPPGIPPAPPMDQPPPAAPNGRISSAYQQVGMFNDDPVTPPPPVSPMSPPPPPMPGVDDYNPGTYYSLLC